MKSKAPLVMMEQMVMILVFALAAALCLQAFVLSDSLSERGEARDRAVLLCENAAETLRLGPKETYVAYYDENWQQREEPSVYRLEVEGLPEDLETLYRARARAARESDGEELFRLDYAWQEVD